MEKLIEAVRKVTKCLEKEMDEMGICRETAVELTRRIGGEFREEASVMENKLLELVESAKNATRSPRTRFDDDGVDI
eukprot:2145333-Karenia_brevis.AAC.1